MHQISYHIIFRQDDTVRLIESQKDAVEVFKLNVVASPVAAVAKVHHPFHDGHLAYGDCRLPRSWRSEAKSR